MNATKNQEFSAPPNTTENSTDTAPEWSFFMPLNIQIGVTIFAVSVFILALIGNTLVLYIVCTVNHMRSSTNTLIGNMAIADLLMTIDIPYILKWFYVHDTWFGTFMGAVLCKFFHAAQVGSLFASVFSLVAISLDRSFAILFPMKTVMTRNVVRFAIAMIWLCTVAFTLPLMIASKNIQLEGTEIIMICNEFWEPMSVIVYTTVLFVVGYAIPLVIIVVAYCLAGLRLWSRKIPGHRNSAAERKAQSSSRRVTVMLITVVIVFALSWLPFQALEIIHKYYRPLMKKIPGEFQFFVPWLGYGNSAINPILYVIFSENYRQEFYRILCRGPSRQDRFRMAVIRGAGAAHTGHMRTTGLSCASSLAGDMPLTRESCASSLAVDIPLTRESCGSSLTVDIPFTRESRGSSLAVDIPLNLESCGSSLAADIPLTHESRGSSLAVDIPLTRESCGSPLAVDIPLTRESCGSSLAVDIPLTCESRGSPLAVDIPLTRESRGGPMAVDIPMTHVSRGVSLDADIPLIRKSCGSSLAVDIPMTRESDSSLAADIPLTHESRGSSLAADIPLTPESSKSSLAVDWPLTRETRGSSLADLPAEELRVKDLEIKDTRL